MQLLSASTRSVNLFTGNVNILGLIVAIAIIVFMIYMLVRPYKEATRLSDNKVKA